MYDLCLTFTTGFKPSLQTPTFQDYGHMKALNGLVSRGHLGTRKQQRFPKHLQCDLRCWAGLRATLRARDCYVLYDKKRSVFLA